MTTRQDIRDTTVAGGSSLLYAVQGKGPAREPSRISDMGLPSNFLLTLPTDIPPSWISNPGSNSACLSQMLYSASETGGFSCQPSQVATWRGSELPGWPAPTISNNHSPVQNVPLNAEPSRMGASEEEHPYSPLPTSDVHDFVYESKGEPLQAETYVPPIPGEIASEYEVNLILEFDLVVLTSHSVGTKNLGTRGSRP